jgi:LacI family transcriptional regulator
VDLRALDSEPPRWLKDWSGDGILTRTFTKKMSKAVEATGLPVIELRSPKLSPNLTWVGMDNHEMGFLVAEHFINRGYHNFAAYTLDTEVFFQQRIHNFIETLFQKGFVCSVLPSSSDSADSCWEENQSRLCQWLKGLPKPVGIYAANDQLGIHILDACLRVNISVPEEVAVVGNENEELLCELATPTLTSVQFNGRQVGYQAAGLLDCLMAGEKVPKETLIDQLVRTAVRKIRENATSGMNVDEVCQQLNVSRSTLERRMKEALQRTPKEEFLRVRFKEVERLLRETNLTVEVIAGQTGFSHCEYLQNTFKQRYGLSPGQFRKTVRVNRGVFAER